VPGYNPQQVANSARNANTVAIAIGETMLAFGQTTNHSFGMGAEQLYGIGSAKPQEVQQLRMSPQITVDAFALTQNGINLLAAGQVLAYLLAGNAFDLYVLDGLNGDQVLFAYVGCKSGNFAEAISTNTPIRDTYTFLAMDVLDPNGNSLLNGGEDALTVSVSGAAPLGASIGLQATATIA
jgi:hypothetical protein